MRLIVFLIDAVLWLVENYFGYHYHVLDFCLYGLLFCISYSIIMYLST